MFYKAIQAQKNLAKIFPKVRKVQPVGSYQGLASDCREMRKKGHSAAEISELLEVSESFVRKHAF